MEHDKKYPSPKFGGNQVSGYLVIFIQVDRITLKTKPMACIISLQVFQKRTDGRLNFNRGWEEYRNGFGKLSQEHYLGNEIIHNIAMQDKYDHFLLAFFFS